MPECGNCGGWVSQRYIDVFGDDHGVILSCHECGVRHGDPARVERGRFEKGLVSAGIPRRALRGASARRAVELGHERRRARSGFDPRDVAPLDVVPWQGFDGGEEDDE